MKSLPNARQHNPDRQIDRALHALRNAQPDSPSGTESSAAFEAMNTRLLRNLRSHPAAKPKLCSRWSWIPNAGLTAAALCAVCVAVLILPARRRDTPPIQQATGSTRMPKAVVQSAASHLFAKTTTLATGSRLESSAQAARPTSAIRRETSPISVAPVDPAFLPSSPAPAAPLTHEEKLLLSTVQHSTPTMLAQLEDHPAEFAYTRSRPEPSPLFAGFRPEPASVAEADQDTENPDAVSTTPVIVPPIDVPNKTTTEFRP